MKLCLLSMILAMTVPALGEDGKLFHSLAYDDALALAKKEDKVLFIDFYTTWCGPCKQMDRTTFKDPEVISWLSERAVAIKIDAEKKRKLARKYKVRGYPALVFAKSDGSMIQTILGYRDGKRFLEESEIILSGGDLLERQKEALVKNKDTDPSERMQFARLLIQEGKHEEALKELLWCFDQGHIQNPSFSGVRSSFLLVEIFRLGREYPAAVEALQSRRDALAAKIDKKEAGMGVYRDFSALNRSLIENDRTLAVYDALLEDDPVRKSLSPFVFPLLLEKQRYQDIKNSTDLTQKIEQIFSRFDGMKTEQAEEMKEMQTGFIVRQAGDYYQVYLGLGEEANADDLAQRILALSDSAATYNNLAWSGYLSGQPVKANLEQARKAHELSKGESAEIADTLARMIKVFEGREAAVKFLQEITPTFLSNRDRAILKQCQQEIETD